MAQVTCFALMNESPVPNQPNILTQLENATLEVARCLGITAVARIGYGTPVYTAFGLGKRQASQHQHRAILCLSGKEVLAAQANGHFSSKDAS